jgi:hypothetical protein
MHLRDNSTLAGLLRRELGVDVEHEELGDVHNRAGHAHSKGGAED